MTKKCEEEGGEDAMRYQTFTQIAAMVLMAGLLLASVDAAGQGLASRRAQHLRHGINTSEWFAQARDYSLERLRTYTTLDDLRLMRQLGFDLGDVFFSGFSSALAFRGPGIDGRCRRGGSIAHERGLEQFAFTRIYIRGSRPGGRRGSFGVRGMFEPVRGDRQPVARASLRFRISTGSSGRR